MSNENEEMVNCPACGQAYYANSLPVSFYVKPDGDFYNFKCTCGVLLKYKSVIILETVELESSKA